MKLKRILCMLMAAMTLSAATVYTAFAEENNADSKPEPSAVEETVETDKDAETGTDGETNETAADADSKDAKKDAKDAENVIASLGFENPCEVDENGNVMLEDGKLIDLILPKVLNGQEQTSISAKSFAGCPYIRSVVIPETILEIGEGAFADCEFLETVYVIGHSEEDMTLGANWNGGAEVVYVYDEIQVEEETPAADAAEDLKAEEQEEADKKDAAEPEQAPDAETVKEPESSDPAKESAEEKAPAAEKDSGKQKDSQEESDAERQEDSKDAASSNEAGKASLQGETGKTAGGSEDVPASAEVSEGAEA